MCIRDRNNEVQWRQVQTTTYSHNDGYRENEYPDDPKAFYRQILELIDYNDFLENQRMEINKTKDLTAFEEHCFKCSLVSFRQITESMSSVPSAFIPIWNYAVAYYKRNDKDDKKKNLHIQVLSTIEKVCARWKQDNCTTI